MRSLILGFLVALLLACPAMAEWVLVVQVQGHKFSYNTEGIERFKGFNRVWIKYDYAETKFGDAGSRVQSDFDTSVARHRDVYIQDFAPDGQVSTSTKGKMKWKPLVPETVMYAVWEKCSRL